MNKSKIDNLRWCTNCLAMSTRPRITFDERGWCSACCWMERKLSLDWNGRLRTLDKILDLNRREDGRFDCIVPVSGGKDGSYVAYRLKHDYGMNPLCVTVTPPTPLEIGEKNLRSFVEAGYAHISVHVPSKALRELNLVGLKEMGFPYFGWLMAVHTVPLIIAKNFDIDLIFYGEDGEVEYGGTTETEDSPFYDISYMKRIYLEGGYNSVLSQASISNNDRYFFMLSEESISSWESIKLTHFSHFENWDPYRNYIVAKEKCGFAESQITNLGTFTNYSQNDQALYALHTYLMYLKYGFGRANQDACIEIRRGAMTRSQALGLVELYDGDYPKEYLAEYLEYFHLDESEFNSIIDKWANKDIFEKRNGYWRPLFRIA